MCRTYRLCHLWRCSWKLESLRSRRRPKEDRVEPDLKIFLSVEIFIREQRPVRKTFIPEPLRQSCSGSCAWVAQLYVMRTVHKGWTAQIEVHRILCSSSWAAQKETSSEPASVHEWKFQQIKRSLNPWPFVCLFTCLFLSWWSHIRQSVFESRQFIITMLLLLANLPRREALD
jgi:hypothetical protein